MTTTRSHDPYSPHGATAGPKRRRPRGGKVPDKAAEVVTWIGSDPDRAERALAVEQERPEARQRKSVLDAIAAVLGDAG